MAIHLEHENHLCYSEVTGRKMRYENVTAEIKGLDGGSYNTWDKIKSFI